MIGLYVRSCYSPLHRQARPIVLRNDRYHDHGKRLGRTKAKRGSESRTIGFRGRNCALAKPLLILGVNIRGDKTPQARPDHQPVVEYSSVVADTVPMNSESQPWDFFFDSCGIHRSSEYHGGVARSRTRMAVTEARAQYLAILPQSPWRSATRRLIIPSPARIILLTSAALSYLPPISGSTFIVFHASCLDQELVSHLTMTGCCDQYIITSCMRVHSYPDAPLYSDMGARYVSHWQSVQKGRTRMNKTAASPLLGHMSCFALT